MDSVVHCLGRNAVVGLGCFVIFVNFVCYRKWTL